MLKSSITVVEKWLSNGNMGSKKRKEKEDCVNNVLNSYSASVYGKILKRYEAL